MILICRALQLFDTEANRKVKREPAFAMDLPKGFIPFPDASNSSISLEEGGDEQEVELQQRLDVVGQLWSFS
jgi:U3 small nucleolar RNA-associated protein 19